MWARHREGAMAAARTVPPFKLFAGMIFAGMKCRAATPPPIGRGVWVRTKASAASADYPHVA
jgi:hypothetical protein